MEGETGQVKASGGVLSGRKLLAGPIERAGMFIPGAASGFRPLLILVRSADAAAWTSPWVSRGEARKPSTGDTNGWPRKVSWESTNARGIDSRRDGT